MGNNHQYLLVYSVLFSTKDPISFYYFGRRLEFDQTLNGASAGISKN